MIEIPTGFLYHASLWLTPDLTSNALNTTMKSSGSSFTRISEEKASSINILGALTEPLTKRIIQVWMFFSWDRPITKSKILSAECQPKFFAVFSNPKEKSQGYPLLFSICDVIEKLWLTFSVQYLVFRSYQLIGRKEQKFVSFFSSYL